MEVPIGSALVCTSPPADKIRDKRLIANWHSEGLIHITTIAIEE